MNHQAAVDAGVGSVMCSYNRINDTYACENEQTLSKDLKGRMGFTGFVMSDWGATHSTVKAMLISQNPLSLFNYYITKTTILIQAANNGLDMEMPDSQYFGKPLADAVNQGFVSKGE